MTPDQEERIKELCISGLFVEGAHHKQWFLEKILAEVTDAAKVASELSAEDYGWEPGIEP